MTPLLVGLCLAAPAQPPYGPFPPPFPPPPAPGLPAPGVPALTLEQFSRAFVPAPGTHHVCLIHPRTGRPVPVCFTLPAAGKLRRFEVNRRSIEFRFDRPGFEVDIIFRLNGTVDVKYDH